MRIKSYELENKLNRIEVDNNCTLGQLIGGILFLNARKKTSNLYRFLWSFRQLLMPISYQIPIHEWNQCKAKSTKILIVLISSSFRYKEFFDSLRSFKFSDIFITTGSSDKIKNETSYEKIKVINKVLPFRLIRAVWKQSKLPIVERFYILAIFTIQFKKYISFKNWLVTKNIDLVISDFDRYPSNIPWIMAARSENIKSISLVHGATHPIENYLPVLAEELWVWGEYQKTLFESKGVSNTKIRIIGNPKVSEFQSNVHRKWKCAGLGLTKMSNNERDRLIELFISGTKFFKEKVIKIHPQDSIADYSKYQNSGITIADNNTSVNEFLKNIDVLFVRRSQLGSDALPYNIPIIILCTDNSHLQNGQILNEYAGCPIISNSEDLKEELDELKTNNVYLDRRLNKQKEYFRSLYQYTSREAKEQLSFKLKKKLNLQKSEGN